MKRKYLSIVALFVMMCMLLSSAMVSRAQEGQFLSSKQGITFQYVPIGNGTNCFSQQVQIYDGQCVDVKLLIQKDSAAEDSAVMTEHLISAALLDSSSGAFVISILNAKVITSAGENIYLDELNGVYRISDRTASDNDFFASTKLNPCSVGDLARGGYFCASIIVSFDTDSADYSGKPEQLKSLADIEGALPADCFYDVEGNVVQLIDFTLDGTMTIRGNDTYASVILVIRGECNITKLVIDCPVEIRRYAYASLKGTSYSESGGNAVTFAADYNATVFNKDSASYEIIFDDSKAESEMTSSELDEKNGTYNFPWRSRKSDWYQKALADTKALRTKEVNVRLVDADGAEVTDAQVNFRLEDYDYYLGCACTGVSPDENKHWQLNRDNSTNMRENLNINFDEFTWENYDNSNEGNEDNTYSFEYSSWGNTNYLRDKAACLHENDITIAAHSLIYPSLHAMSDVYNRENTTVTDALKEYIFSEEYTPEGFNQKVKDHIAEAIKSYAGYVYVFGLVNEEYYYNQFFQLIYGVDDESNGFAAGNGFTKEQIATILSNEGKSSADNNEKMKTLQEYLNNQELIPAAEAGKIVCSWADTAQDAWDSTIDENSWYTSDDLILYCNDACCKGDNSGNENGHYQYYFDYAAALSEPANYSRGKALVNMMGLEMADGGSYQISPDEALEILDDMQSINKTMLATEANYWVDHPYTDTGVDNSNYGVGPQEYLTSDITSEAEKEFAYDYAYYIMTALYSHPASAGIHWVGYPQGQIGCRYYSGDVNITPLGDAYRELTMKEWNTAANLTVTAGGSQTPPLSLGTYLVSVKKDGRFYQEEVEISKAADTVTIVLDKPLINENESIAAALYTDSDYNEVKENLGKFESMEALYDALSGKTGYLLVQLNASHQIKTMPDADISGMKLKAINGSEVEFCGDTITLPCDVIVEGNISIDENGATIDGANHAITLMGSNQALSIDGGKLTADNLSLIIGGDIYASINADIDGLDELSVSCLKDGYQIDPANADAAWDYIMYNADLVIASDVSNLSRLSLYGRNLYLTGSGSLSTDSAAGFYGNVYLQKQPDGTLSRFGLQKTMKDMVWQIRLYIYDELQKNQFQVSAGEMSSCAQGSVLAYISEEADGTVSDKLGFMCVKDSGWDTYDNKLVQDCRLYYDDGTADIDHLWEEDYTIDKEPGCGSAGSKSIHCSVCDALKDETEIPATGNHNFSGRPYLTSIAGKHFQECADCGAGSEPEVCTAGEVKKENIVEPTCIQEGSHDEVTYCTVCGQELSRASCVDEKTEHTPSDWKYDNNSHWKVCTAGGCGAEIEGSRAAHDFGGDDVCTVCGFERQIYEGLWFEEIPDYIYTGKAIIPEIIVYNGALQLEKGKDYTVAYKNNVNAGKAVVKVKGKGNFAGVVTKEFTIKGITISGLKMPDEIYAAYTGKAIKPALTVTNNGKALKAGKDYEINVKDSRTLKDAGDYTLIVSGKGNYSGTAEIAMHITKTKLASKLTVSKIAKQNYNNGQAVTPAVIVKDGRNTLTLGTHYELEYSDNCEPGTATVTVIGKEDYAGTKTVTFKIVGTPISKAKVEGVQNLAYTGGGLEQSGYTVSLKGRTLAEGTDFTVSYLNNVRRGKAAMILTGKGGYTGSLKKTFKILPYTVKDGDEKVAAAASDTFYARGGVKTAVTVSFDGADGEWTLTEGVDYTVTYKNNKAVAGKTADKAPVAIVKFKGNFSGTRKLQYTIFPQNLGALSMVANDKVYAAKKNAWKQTAVKIVDVNGKVLKAGTDYDKKLTYTLEDGAVLNDTSDVKAGATILVTAKGIGNYADSQLVGSYRIVTALISGAKAVAGPVEYDGTAKEPKLESIELGKDKIKLIEGTDYIITGYSNNVNKGTASMTIRGIGSYGGTKVVKFKIKAKTFS